MRKKIIFALLLSSMSTISTTANICNIAYNIEEESRTTIKDEDKKISKFNFFKKKKQQNEKTTKNKKDEKKKKNKFNWIKKQNNNDKKKKKKSKKKVAKGIKIKARVKKYKIQFAFQKEKKYYRFKWFKWFKFTKSISARKVKKTWKKNSNLWVIVKYWRTIWK